MIVILTDIKNQARKLQMGQFSWKTQDTNEPIFCDWDRYGDRQTIYMIDPRDGTQYKEDSYKGYGIFGGRDFYELLADINKNESIILDKAKNDIEKFNLVFAKDFKDLTQDELKYKREFGIVLWFKFVEWYCYSHDHKIDSFKIISPILVKNPDSWITYIGFGKHPESDPNQGWHKEEEM